MKVVCASCVREGRPGLLAEKAPFDDPRVTHGMCPDHLRRMREEIAAWQGRRAAAAPPARPGAQPVP